MKGIISKSSTISGLALTVILLISWGEPQVVAQSFGRGVGSIVGGVAGAIDGAVAGVNAGGDIGGNLTNGASANISADFRASLGTNGDGSAAQSPVLDNPTTTAKPENFFNKMKDMLTGGSSSTSAPTPQQQQSSSSPSSNVGQNLTEGIKSSASALFGNTSNSTTTSKPEGLMDKLANKVADFSHSVKESFNRTMEDSKNATSRSGNETRNGSDDGIGSKIAHGLNKGGDMLKDAGNKFEEKTSEIGEKTRNFTSRVDNAIHNSTSRDGDNNNKNMTQSMKDFINNSKSKSDKTREGSRDKLKDDDGNNIMVELFDKAHELSKMPMETILKPLDKMLGVDKDPLLKMMDNSHDVLRKPLDMLTKPMDSMLDGAFKISDELEKEQPSAGNQKKGNETKSNSPRKKSDRSVVGEMADKAVELAESPLELALKPFDKLLGNSDRKNPLVRMLNEVYGLSKKPVDKIAKPFEDVLRKMADRYQLSVEYPNNDSEDPKLVTRLANGALNVADHVVTKPLEIAMRPWNRILGYDDKKKKNSIVEAAHAWKNATRLGLELLTKPIDRIIKEIADLGDIKDDEEREEEYKKRREEASRLVELIDKIHHAAQTPFEIILRPVNKIVGSKKKKNNKQAVLRAWDLLHYVMRVPIQVVSKSIEDAILGERSKKHDGKQSGAYATASAGTSESSSRSGLSKPKKDRKKHEDKKNFFVDNIKKAEKLAIKPLELLSMPMRKLILGNNDMKSNKSNHHSGHNNNSSASNGSSRSDDLSDSSSHNDKIIATIKKMNNVLLTPMEILTQPIADTLFSKKGELKINATITSNFTPSNSTSTTTTTTTKPSQQNTSTSTTQSPQSG